MRLAGLLLASIALAYDPLATTGSAPETIRFTVHDQARQRDIPILIYLPPTNRTLQPVVLFSHGLGGSREGSTFLGRHWSSRGYVAVFVQHPGSDESVWRDARPGERVKSLREAANLENYILRAKDIPAVLDQLERWNRQDRHALRAKLDLARVGMSGHSFGAITTQAVSGQTVARGLVSLTDARIKAAIVFSPSSPVQVRDPRDAFANVKIPWMLMTGTQDVAAIGNTTVAQRLAVFPALPPGGKYELVLHEAEHSVFTDRPLPGESGKRNPNHHRAILALSTAFWDAWLRNDREAKAWLDGGGPATILEKQDRWLKK